MICLVMALSLYYKDRAAVYEKLGQHGQAKADLATADKLNAKP